MLRSVFRLWFPSFSFLVLDPMLLIRGGRRAVCDYILSTSRTFRFIFLFFFFLTRDVGRSASATEKGKLPEDT